MGGFIAPIIAAVASSAVSGAFGGGSAPSIPTPSAPPAPPSEVSPPVVDAAAEERKRRARATGLRSTVLTSGLGVQEEALTQKKTLLGS